MKSNIGFSIIQLANCHKFLNCIAVLGSLQCGENSVLDNQTIALSHDELVFRTVFIARSVLLHP